MTPAAAHTAGASMTPPSPARTRPTTTPASGHTRRAGTVTGLHPVPQTAELIASRDGGELDPGSGHGRIRTVQRDGTVVWTTPILEYQPVLTSQDYAVLARLRDQARADIARRAIGLPDAA